MSVSDEKTAEWTIEEFYFGNAVYPSYVTYRTCGDRLQVRDELEMRLSEDDGHYLADVDKLPDFTARHVDCQVMLLKSMSIGTEKLCIPALYLIGWRELTTEEEKKFYERDKRAAWRRPDE
jgi:hypothetical protein